MWRDIHAVMQDAQHNDLIGQNFEEEHMAATTTIARYVPLAEPRANIVTYFSSVGVFSQFRERRQERRLICSSLGRSEIHCRPSEDVCEIALRRFSEYDGPVLGHV